jgi:ketosteroid isomerase-like protein
MSQENVDLAKQAYDDFTNGRMDELRAMFSEDAEWVSSAELPGGGDIKGAGAIMDGFAQIPQSWKEFSVEPSEFIDGGDWVTVRGTQRGTGEAGSFESPFAHLMKFEGGKLVRGEFFTDSAEAVKALK